MQSFAIFKIPYFDLIFQGRNACEKAFLALYHGRVNIMNMPDYQGLLSKKKCKKLCITHTYQQI